MDVVDTKTRSRMMAGIRGRDTRPELVVRSLLHRAGFRFRLHDRSLPGAPDIVMRSRNIVIFVNGCFWHRHRDCVMASTPASRPEFWVEKFRANVLRDARNIEALATEGWRVLIVWECAIPRRAASDEGLGASLDRWIRSSRKKGEIPVHSRKSVGLREGTRRKG